MQCPSCHVAVEGGPPFCPSCGAPLPREPGPDPLLGRVFQDKYKIIKLLGEGGMGAVYVGEQSLGQHTRKVAIKTLHAHLSRDEKVRDRFQREVGTLATLEHPNTVQVFDFGTSPDGVLYIVMEFVQGRSIADHLEKEGAMSAARVEKILAQICGSLAEAHGKGIIHRDLKPDNIILTERAGQKDFVKVLDFGIAKRSGEADRNEKQLTQQGMVLGTPPYMSPEQFTGQPLDARSDIYSLAVMAYEMLTATLPFDAKTAWEWATLHMTAAPKAIEATPNGAALPESMRNAVMRALAKDKEQRFANINEFNDRFSGKIGPSASESAQKEVTSNHKSMAPVESPMDARPAGTKDMPNAPSQLVAPIASAYAAPALATPAPAPAHAPVVAAAAGAELLKGKTQMGEPMAFPGDFGASPTPGPGPYAPPPLVMANAPPAHVPPAYAPQQQQPSYATPGGASVPRGPAHGGGGNEGRSSNKGLILGVAGVVAVLSIGLVAWGAGAFGKGSSSTTVAPIDLGTSAPVTSVQPVVTPDPGTAVPASPLGGAVAPLNPVAPGGAVKPPATAPKPTTNPATPPGTTPPGTTPTKPPVTPPVTPPATAPTPTPTPRPPPPPPPPPVVPVPPPAPTPVPPPPTRVDPPICARARDARARNSPVAQTLEAQCRAAGGTP